MKDYRTSILVNKQVPQFIQEEYPTFIRFLEAYYEFLENEQFDINGSENNDLTVKLKSLRTVSDIDKSLNDFEDYFFNTYAQFFPKDLAINKEFLIKNIKQLYSTKGSDQSFKLLFKMLFNEDINITRPGQYVLRASDGKWQSNKVIRIDPIIKTFYIANGNAEYQLAQEVNADEIQVFINNVLLENSSFYIKKEYKKIVFNQIPDIGSSIIISYNNFDFPLLHSRKIFGKKSNTTAIIENISPRFLYGTNYYDIFINDKTIIGLFENGEHLSTNIILDDGQLLEIELDTVTNLKEINLVYGGRDYKIDDQIVIKGSCEKSAAVIITKVATGIIDTLEVLFGGSGFKINDNVKSIGSSSTVFRGKVSTIDTSGEYTPNTINVFSTIISPYQSTTIDAVDYNFPDGKEPTQNIDTIIANALSEIVISDIGSILTCNVLYSEIQTSPGFDVTPINVVNNISLKDLGAIGRIHVVNSGTGYSVGDKVIFTNHPYDFFGTGANAEVSVVSSGGGVQRIKINNPGWGYNKDIFPTLTINSTGVGAIITVASIMGDGEIIIGAYGNKGNPGEILELKMIDSGLGYMTVPIIDLSVENTHSGNTLAIAEAVIRPSFETLPGKWINSDGMLSDQIIKIQNDNYYIDYSYIIKSKVEFTKYKDILLNLLHASGTSLYSEYEINDNINAVYNGQIEQFDASLLYYSYAPARHINNVFKSISGTVNINSSIYVIGTNVNFITANINGVIFPKTSISVNNEIRIVNNIINANTFTVSEPFNTTATNQELIIYCPQYNDIITQSIRQITLSTSSEEVIITQE